MHLNFIYQCFILFSLHSCLLSFYQNVTAIIGKQPYHLKEAGTSLELRKGLLRIKQSLITSLLQIVSSFASFSAFTQIVSMDIWVVGTSNQIFTRGS